MPCRATLDRSIPHHIVWNTINASRPADRLRYQITMLKIENNISMTENSQSRSIACIGVLLPAKAMCLKKLQQLNAINISHVQLRLPYIHALTSGIKTRFEQSFDYVNLPLSSALRPHFLLFWLTWLKENHFGF